MPIDVTETIIGIDALSIRMDGALRDVVSDSLHLLQAAGMANAPVGKPGNTTNAPGDLARSIDVEGPHGGDGYYEGEVGPTVIYGRQRELGGDIYKFDGWMVFHWGDRGWVHAHHVYQHPEPYMKPAEEEMLPEIEALAVARLGAVVVT